MFRLYADVQHSSARLDESRHLINSLKSELLLHEKLQKEKASGSNLGIVIVCWMNIFYVFCKIRLLRFNYISDVFNINTKRFGF